MNNPNIANPNRRIPRKQENSLGEIVDFVWRLKYWIIITILISVSAASIYLRMLTPMFERTTWVMLNRENEKSNELYLLPEYTNQTNKKNERDIFSELFVLKSPTTISKVVTELGIIT